MRLFIGIDLSYELKQALREFQTELKGLGLGGSYKSEDNFHITLEFLGELDKSNIPTLTETLANAASKFKPFELTVGGLGAFPSFRRAHTLWTAVNGSLQELNRLRNDLHLDLKNKGFRLEERQFKPHITLVSRPNFDKIDLSVVQNKKLGYFQVEDIVLFESNVVNGKRAYLSMFSAGLQQPSVSG